VSRQSARKSAKLGLLALVAFVTSVVPPVAYAVGGDSIEYAVKAAYLYKLGEFVEWPASVFESTDSPVNLCIVGNDPFDGTLDKTVEGRRIGTRSISVRRLKSLDRASNCQILYIGTSDVQQASRWLETARGEKILTVTDSMSRGPAGSGIVNFFVKDNHVRFEIDNDTAVASGLVISSKLLALAQPMRSREPGE